MKDGEEDDKLFLNEAISLIVTKKLLASLKLRQVGEKVIDS